MHSHSTIFLAKMDSVVNGLHAFASSSLSTIIHASHGGGSFSVRANRPISGLKQKTPSPSPFSFLRQADHSSNLLVKISQLCSQLPMVIETDHQHKKQSDGAAIHDHHYEKGAENQDCTHCYGCQIYDDCGDGNLFEFYTESYSKLLRRISLAEVKMYAELCYLGNLTYHIPKIKEEDLLGCMGLLFVTSHLEMQSKTVKHQTAEEVGELNTEDPKQDIINPFAAYASAFIKKTHLEENKADRVNDASSQPCGWYICDDEKTGIRYFIIQGSESVASWQANFRFEPVQFEVSPEFHNVLCRLGYPLSHQVNGSDIQDRDVLVHKGIYEVAKGIYEQLLPEVQAHLKSSKTKRRPLLCFTGHSLGGSIAMLLNLMLLLRAEAPTSTMLPVVTYGAPYIMCGGEELMLELGLPKNHIQGIALHRDIVPRAFSVTLPSWLIDIVKAINVNFRSNPCLDKKKLMYVPMGEFLILQPEESFSPSHYLLPPGPGLYLLTSTLPDTLKAERMVKAAQRAFLDYPYPMEVLKDPSAYGWEGTIVRDHDMNSYLRCLHDLIKYEQNQIKKMRSNTRNRFRWTPSALLKMEALEDNRDTVRQPKASAKKDDHAKYRKLTNIFETTTESMMGCLAILNFQR